MTIPAIRVTQSAIDSYKASRGFYNLPKIALKNSESIIQSVAFSRKPMGDEVSKAANSMSSAAKSYAISHGSPVSEVLKLDINV